MTDNQTTTQDALEGARNTALAISKGGRLVRAFDAVRTGANYLESPLSLTSGAGALGRAGAVVTTLAKPIAYGLTAIEVAHDIGKGDARSATSKTTALTAAVYAGGQCAVLAAPTGPIGMLIAGSACGTVAYLGTKKATEKTYDVAADFLNTGGTATKGQLAAFFNQFSTGERTPSSLAPVPVKPADSQPVMIASALPPPAPGR